MADPRLKYASIRAVHDQVSCNLEGEAVILHLGSGTYFGLNEVGCRVWSMIQQPRSYEEILSQILEEYEVDPARLESDIGELLQKMSEAGLIQIGSAGADDAVVT